MSILRRRTARSRRPVRKKRRQHLLEVTATAETERRRRNQKIVLYAGEAVVVAGLLAFAWLGVRALIQWQFHGNDRYNVRVVEVDTDGVMTREEALAMTGIREGVNVFSLDLEAAQRTLAAVPKIKDARVERMLPDKVVIDIDARKPVAWIAPKDTGEDPSAMETSRLIDRDGVMMKPEGFEPAQAGLPVIYGIPTEQWKPGDRVELRELRAAVELFDRVAERADPQVSLRAADVGKGWCILAWDDPQTRYTFGLDDLSAQLDRLRFILMHVGQSSRKIATANLIPSRNTPVTFRDDPPPAPEPAPAPAPKKKKS
ncbi:MAG: FtsQ-type POTRA domain-containing protein [Chthoniobacterales bacterium]|nr:FtsQ-type POTRA domain-containing protein [Chthoniobacterales bacterium]